MLHTSIWAIQLGHVLVSSFIQRDHFEIRPRTSVQHLALLPLDCGAAFHCTSRPQRVPTPLLMGTQVASRAQLIDFRLPWTSPYESLVVVWLLFSLVQIPRCKMASLYHGVLPFLSHHQTILQVGGHGLHLRQQGRGVPGVSHCRQHLVWSTFENFSHSHRCAMVP